MADSFLNLTGLSYYTEKLLGLFAKKSDVNTALADKVDKETGKGLSTNDYTTTEKNKLSNIASGAQVNVIESVKVNGTALSVTSKAVDVSVPTAVSELTNDTGYITSADVPEGAAASGITPKMDGTAARGTDNGFARGDHVHPTDTSRAAASDLTALETRVGTAETKLSGIAEGAQVNVIESIKVNNTAQTVTGKAVNITVPTALSDLTNDADYVTDASYVHTDNNLTDTLLTKLNGIEAGATKTTVDSALSDSSANPVQNKVINTALAAKAPLASPTFTGTPKAPTATAGTNTTQIATTEFVSTAIANAIAGVTSITYRVVTTLPASGENGVIYLVAHSHGTQDVYDEYIWAGSSFEKLGNTDIDLSGYMLKTDMVAITTSEIDALFA